MPFLPRIIIFPRKRYPLGVCVLRHPADFRASKENYIILSDWSKKISYLNSKDLHTLTYLIVALNTIIIRTLVIGRLQYYPCINQYVFTAAVPSLKMM
jgi:hypothetical protein